MKTETDIIDIIPCSNQLGEGLLWDPRRQVFIWSDIKGKVLYILSWGAKEPQTLVLPDMLCSFGLTQDPNILIAAFTRSIAWLNIKSGEVKPNCAFDFPDGIRMNDGRVGPDGAFYVGSMVEDEERAEGKWGQLFRYSQAGGAQVLLDGIHISNGLCWSPDRRYMYHADSPKQKVFRYEFDSKNGTIGAPTPYLSIEKGYPDGAVTSADGLYLSALWDGFRVGIFDSAGAEIGALPLPVPQVTITCFGGPNLDVLAVASAWDGLEGEARSDEMGHLFLLNPGMSGMAPDIFKDPPPSF